MLIHSPQSVLHFWFHSLSPEQWFIKDESVDQRIAQRFLATTKAAARGECHDWRHSIQGRLAEIIVLDQFPRNIWRDTPKAFAQDSMALALAQEAIKLTTYNYLSSAEKQFLLMPFMHSESVLIQKESVALFSQIENPNAYKYAILHKQIIDRFERYPHRNKILGRTSSTEEQLFLQEPNSSF